MANTHANENTKDQSSAPHENSDPANEQHTDGDAPEVEVQASADPADFELDDEAQIEGLDALDPLEELIQENAELKDKLLRSVADMENLRRRLEREKSEATLYAATNFARDILSVNDNLGRALDAVPQEERDHAAQAIKTLLEGLEMTQRELLNVFERHGIKSIDPMDEKFDPNQHQAMFEVADAEKPAGTVVQVVQTGFMIGQRVLRPAMVGVSKAP